MTLRQLETLYAIIKAGSLTAAARSLHVTQPAVSAVLKHTEQQLGMKLFERFGRRLQPTPEALALLPDLEEVFGRIEAVNRLAQELRDGRIGQLVVATSPTLVNALLPNAVALFRQRNPAVHVTIHSLPTPLVVERVGRRQIDVGLVYGPVTDPAVEIEELITTEIACVVSKRHALARKRVIRAVDLRGEPIISLGTTTRLGMLIDEACRNTNVPSPVVAVEASSSLAACLMVSYGAGVALVDRSIVLSGKFGDLAFRPFRPKIAVPVQLIYSRGRPRSRAALQFSQDLRRVVKDGASQ